MERFHFLIPFKPKCDKRVTYKPRTPFLLQRPARDQRRGLRATSLALSHRLSSGPPEAAILCVNVVMEETRSARRCGERVLRWL